MPTLSTSDWPPPDSWGEFEIIVWDLMRIEWQDPNATRNGRQGQQQNGVDIYGQREGVGGYIGVQCKRHGRAAKLTFDEVLNEITKAEAFKPPLREFIVATTAPIDAKLQQEIRLLSVSRRESGSFPVFVRFWEEIGLRLTANTEVAKRHYPQFFLADSPDPSATTYNDLSSISGDRLQLFVSSRITADLKEERHAVVSALEDPALAKAWHWERDGYAAANGYQAVCNHHVHVSDALVLIIGSDISANVLAEYYAARRSHRPCFVMVKDGCIQDSQLRDFLKKEGPHFTYRKFRNTSELRTLVLDAFLRQANQYWRLARLNPFYISSSSIGGKL